MSEANVVVLSDVGGVELHLTELGKVSKLFREIGLDHEVEVSSNGFFRIEILGRREIEHDSGWSTLIFSNKGKFIEALNCP